MGMDPVTIGLIMASTGAAAGAIGDWRAQNAQNRQRGLVNNRANTLWMGGASPYQGQMDQFIAGLPRDPLQLDQNSGNIDVQSILQRINPGNDALMQFLNSDPSRQLLAAGGEQFDPTAAWSGLAANDALQIDRAANATRAGYAGLGQRFGTAAIRGEGRMRGDFAAQIAARNAGIGQSAFESAQGRRLAGTQAGLGMQLQGAQSLANTGINAAQIAAGLSTANQENLYRNNAFNLGSQQQNYLQRLQAIQAGFGMQMGTANYNRDLLAIMAGLPPSSGGGGWQAAGQAGMDIGQLLMFLPFLRGNNGKQPTTTAPGTP